jgi:hypothetical protein
MSDDRGITPSQETDHVSPDGVTPQLGKGAQDTWRSLRLSIGGRLDKTGVNADDGLRRRGGGKPVVAGVYTNERLSLSTTWEGPRLTGRGFKPDSGNPTVRDYRGASET